MRGQAMKRVCEKLGRHGYNMSDMDALEFFAREGDWQTKEYAGKVKTVEAWEVNPNFENGLKKNLPDAVIRIGNSFELARDDMNKGKFDFIIIDNPQCLYGPNNEYCEHFEALELVPFLLKERGIVMFNINSNPFDYDKHPEWQKRRNEFYNLTDTSLLTKDFLLSFYKDFFKQMGLKIEFAWFESRNEQYLAYLIYGLHE